MNLLKVSALSLIATFVKLLAVLVINKAISIFVGPSGLAVIGQFQNALGIIQTAAKGGINTGVTKYTAEYHDNIDARDSLWTTSLKLTLICSLIISIILILGSSYFSKYILKTNEYSYVFIVFGFTITLFSINQLLLSILNGLKEIRDFISINILQSVYGFVFTTLLIVFFKLDGALIAMVTNQSVIFFIVLWKLKKNKKITIGEFKKKYDLVQLNKLFRYSLMTLVSAFTAPVSLMIVRNYIGETISWDAAGYWQAVTYISAMYLMVITTALSTYFLPRLSEVNDKKELRKELKKGYIIILPLVACLSIIIYLLKDFIILALFSESFHAMRELFKWQLIGDFFKVSAWLIAYLMLAKAMTKMFIITEILFSLIFVCLSLLLIDKLGLVGVTYAYTINYSLYLIAMLILMKKHIFN